QSTAEQDMELIRTKRATSSAGTNGPAGQPKSKYRKRSRATPPGKCHSCNIRETPEWRRGPDGARTLCNACGLHYAKLMRKRDKSANGEAPHIDLETLRASARAAD
ncbi:GATA zinc finger-domain-containing protein, partial [Flammula alnicola]